MTRKNVDEFKLLPPHTIECFLYARYDNTFTGPSNITDWFQFYFVDKGGQPTTYRIGKYEVIYLGTDNGCTNFFGRDVTIRDCTTEKYYEYRSKCWYNCFIQDELKPLLEKLNRCQTEEEIIQCLKTHIPYNMLERKFLALENACNSMKKESEVLKNKINTLTSVISDIRRSLESLDNTQ